MVSIVVVHYNTYDLTYACVASCFQFIPEETFEIILVNNGSDEKPLDQLLEAFPSVKYVDAAGNIGFSKGNNLGIQSAEGDFILLLNSDCELKEDSVSEAVKVLETNNDIAIITTRLEFENGIPQNNYQSFPSISGDLLELSRFFKLMNQNKYASNYENRLLDPSENHFCDWVWGAFFMFRKSDLTQLENQQLSDRFFMYGEDTEWCWQFKQLNKRCFYLSSSVTIHHMGQSNFGDSSKKWKTIIGNEILTVRKFRGSFYTFFFRSIRGLKYMLTFRKQNWFFTKLYLFQSFK